MTMFFKSEVGGVVKRLAAIIAWPAVIVVAAVAFVAAAALSIVSRSEQ